MTHDKRLSVISSGKEHKNVIQGQFIDLHPYEQKHTPEIVRLRNQEKSLYYLNQKKLLTIEKQNEWYSNYILRNDDINWCISNKSGDIIGSIRLYTIDPQGEVCEEGGFIIDEVHSMSGPYALEAKIIVFDFAFDVLQIKKVINVTRKENKNMISIGKRMGFQFVKKVDKDNVIHNHYELRKSEYKRDILIQILDNWKVRT